MADYPDKFSDQFEQTFQIGDVVQVKVATKSSHYFKRNQMVVNAIDENTWFECFWTETIQPNSSQRFVSFKFHVSLLEAVAPSDVETGGLTLAASE